MQEKSDKAWNNNDDKDGSWSSAWYWSGEKSAEITSQEKMANDDNDDDEQRNSLCVQYQIIITHSTMCASEFNACFCRCSLIINNNYEGFIAVVVAFSVR